MQRLSKEAARIRQEEIKAEAEAELQAANRSVAEFKRNKARDRARKARAAARDRARRQEQAAREAARKAAEEGSGGGAL
jgi:hypothetical protein